MLNNSNYCNLNIILQINYMKCVIGKSTDAITLNVSNYGHHKRKQVNHVPDTKAGSIYSKNQKGTYLPICFS